MIRSAGVNRPAAGTHGRKMKRRGGEREGRRRGGWGEEEGRGKEGGKRERLKKTREKRKEGWREWRREFEEKCRQNVTLQYFHIL